MIDELLASEAFVDYWTMKLSDLLLISGKRGSEDATIVYHNWLRDQIARLPADTHWQTLAQGALRDDLYSEQRELTTEVLKRDTGDRGAEDGDAETLIDAWLADNRSSVERTRSILSDLKEADTLDIAMLSVALREIRNLTETGSAVTGAPAGG